MKTLLRLEEWAQLLLGILLFSQLSFAWWWFPALLLLPDIGMLGYVFNSRIGAITYNVFHHKAIAVVFIALGWLFWGEFYTLVGVILFSHSALDRAVGYGLKYTDDFKHTHLGGIGRN